MIQITDAFVIHKQPYRETSYLVDLFTEQLGRIKIIAKAVRTGRKAHQFNLFCLSQWHLSEGRDFYFYKEIDFIKNYQIQGRAVWSAYYLNELILRLIPQAQADAALFFHYQNALVALDETQPSTQFLRTFEYQLLNSLGVLPDFLTDDQQSSVDPEQSYIVLNDHGVCRTESGYRNGFEVSGALLYKITQQQLLDHQEAQRYKGLMRYLITPLLGEKPLQSRVWLEKLYKNFHKE